MPATAPLALSRMRALVLLVALMVAAQAVQTGGRLRALTQGPSSATKPVTLVCHTALARARARTVTRPAQSNSGLQNGLAPVKGKLSGPFKALRTTAVPWDVLQFIGPQAVGGGKVRHAVRSRCRAA
jgi:hypothetical protein